MSTTKHVPQFDQLILKNNVTNSNDLKSSWNCWLNNFRKFVFKISSVSKLARDDTSIEDFGIVSIAYSYIIVLNRWSLSCVLCIMAQSDLLSARSSWAIKYLRHVLLMPASAYQLQYALGVIRWRIASGGRVGSCLVCRPGPCPQLKFGNFKVTFCAVSRIQWHASVCNGGLRLEIERSATWRFRK